MGGVAGNENRGSRWAGPVHGLVDVGEDSRAVDASLRERYAAHSSRRPGHGAFVVGGEVVVDADSAGCYDVARVPAVPKLLAFMALSGAVVQSCFFYPTFAFELEADG